MFLIQEIINFDKGLLAYSTIQSSMKYKWVSFFTNPVSPNS